ncbi:hypothetical protein [Paraburkholderia sp. J10-1]
MYDCSSRVLKQYDLLAFDTDVVAPNGYRLDISRTWLAGDEPRGG